MLSRRELMTLSVAGLVAGWRDPPAVRVRSAKSCILLWMSGGPSQAHTFDLKPHGDFRPISTAIPGVKISEHLPEIAKQAKHLAVIRGMTTGESHHDRARDLMRSGFRGTPLSVGECESGPPEPDRYGRTKFGRDCLMARRLVEAGAPFVEVALPGWDTHRDAPRRIKSLSEQLDPAMAALIGDLSERGLLESTLVVWMGEFGRRPGDGRQHYSRAWTTVLAGGGVRGGQVVGDTGPTGMEVVDRPVSAADYFAMLGIDPVTTASTPIAAPPRTPVPGTPIRWR